MSAELPAISAVIARLTDPTVNLAAYGSVVFPLAILIEAPVIMLLAASTALSKDWATYTTLRRYVRWLGASLTLVHILIAFTPVFDWIVISVISAPPEVLEPSRIGLMIMTPWTWSIAYRRFNQGVLIRFGQSKAVSLGTVVRLAADVTVLAVGYWVGSIAGIVVATCAVSAGVIFEALFVGLRVRPVLAGDLRDAPPANEAVNLRSFAAFYVPLALTSLLNLAIQPVSSAALSRMPQPLESLAVWPVVYGLFFMLRCLGHAYQEVAVALLDKPGAHVQLRRFALTLGSSTTLILALIALTPLSRIWFVDVSGLNEELAGLAGTAIWFGLLLPALSALLNWFQGILVHARKTRGITESVFVFLVACSIGLWIGVMWGGMPGIFIGLASYSVGGLFQLSWVRWKGSGVLPKD